MDVCLTPAQMKVPDLLNQEGESMNNVQARKGSQGDVFGFAFYFHWSEQFFLYKRYYYE